MKKRVGLMIPFKTYETGYFIPCILHVFKALSAEYDVSYMTSNEYPLDYARERLLRNSLQNDVDYLIFIDSDMLMSGEHALAMIRYLEGNQEADACTGIYFGRFEPYNPILYKYLPEKESYVPILPPSIEPFEVDGCGLGFFAIRTQSIFKSNMLSEAKLFWFDKFSEDFNFCKILAKYKLRLFCLPYVEIEHFGGVSRGWMYQAYKAVKKDFKEIKAVRNQNMPRELEKIMDGRS